MIALVKSIAMLSFDALWCSLESQIEVGFDISGSFWLVVEIHSAKRLTCLVSFELPSTTTLLEGVIQGVVASERWGSLPALFSERFRFAAWARLIRAGTIFDGRTLASWNQFENGGKIDNTALTSLFEIPPSDALLAWVASEVLSLATTSIWYSSSLSESGSDKLSMTLTCLVALVVLFGRRLGWRCFLSTSPHSSRRSAARISCKPVFLFRWGRAREAGRPGTAVMLSTKDCEIDSMTRRTCTIRNSLSFNRRERDAGFVTRGVEPLDIIRIFELAVLIKSALLGVWLRWHIDRWIEELQDLEVHRMCLGANGYVSYSVTRAFYVKERKMRLTQYGRWQGSRQAHGRMWTIVGVSVHRAWDNIVSYGLGEAWSVRDDGKCGIGQWMVHWRWWPGSSAHNSTGHT